MFNFAIPVMLFRAMAQMDGPAAGAGDLLLAFYIATATVFVCGILITRFGLGRPAGEATILGFAGAYGNTVLIGIPVVLTVFGEAGAFPAFLIISLHSLLFFTLVTVLMELAGSANGELRHLPGRILKSIAFNPIIIGLVLGLAVNRSGLVLPVVVDSFAELLGRAAIPCALFATGAALRSFSIQGALPLASLLVVLKGVVHPMATLAVCTLLFDLPPAWVAVAVVMGATPVGVNPYLFASRYRVGEAECATAIALSTPLAVVTITLALAATGTH